MMCTPKVRNLSLFLFLSFLVFSLGIAPKEDLQKGVIQAMLKECSDQSECLVEMQVKARDVLASASDAQWRERMQLLLEVLR